MNIKRQIKDISIMKKLLVTALAAMGLAWQPAAADIPRKEYPRPQFEREARGDAGLETFASAVARNGYAGRRFELYSPELVLCRGGEGAQSGEQGCDDVCFFHG